MKQYTREKLASEIVEFINMMKIHASLSVDSENVCTISIWDREYESLIFIDIDQKNTSRIYTNKNGNYIEYNRFESLEDLDSEYWKMFT